ncbi:NEL-type E3 ubiquitin ligase domain-containing protein [Bradyrhizobium arachidis]|uniref:NEL-type E3 ubiquitin ligase domain-containing protein n=1 Tax=Bradyrhizobium arachidis TaxID=858423 RepID=UPI002162E50F|nr:NEL-type E3 ubiquitin ligase domain-containing protein [Bradyrhizobium arachidis]UVO30200.1 E3 ubiquitin--protein ligase [Bradyrhizobium arachidis]
MDTGPAQRGTGITPEASERAHRQGCLCGLARATTEWVGALTRARASTAGPAGNPTNPQAPAGREMSLDGLLEGWAGEEGQGEHEDRQEAVRRTRALCEAVVNVDLPPSLDLSSLSLTTLSAALPAGLRRLNIDNNQLVSLPDTLPATLQSLDAGGNQLSTLPSLPAGLRRLNVDDNQLDSLPDILPATLQQLNARGNRLTSLPQTLPAGIRQLDAGRNRLTTLPEALPSELNWLNIGGNELTSLPNTLPTGLMTLYADHNELTSLPETLLTQLGSECTIDLDENPLPERVRTNLAAAMNVEGYAGPQVFFSMGGGAEQSQARPLAEAVADWLKDEPAVAVAWQGFADEPGAQEYSRFLDRLRLPDTVNYGDAAFRQAVADGLRQATTRPRLREQYFQLAIGASETCEDRIILTWNSMQTARLNADVEDGAYDERLDELLQEGRIMFRLDALEGIAREKVRSLRFVDEIEVYLAYQVKLREPLQLRHIAPNMRFYAVAHVTEHDIAAAETSVRTQESAGFTDYLATRWQPWDTVVSRIAPEAHAATQRRLADAMGGEFQSRLAQRLAEHQLTGDADAEREIGAQILKEITREIKGTLTHQVLADRGLVL